MAGAAAVPRDDTEHLLLPSPMALGDNRLCVASPSFPEAVPCVTDPLPRDFSKHMHLERGHLWCAVSLYRVRGAVGEVHTVAWTLFSLAL